MKLNALVSTAILALTLIGCSSPKVQTGPNAERNENGLVRVDHARFKNVFIDDDFDFSSYSTYFVKHLDTSQLKVKLQRHSNIKRDWELTDQDRIYFTKLYSEAMVDKLQNEGKLTLVDEVQKDTLVIEGHLLEILPYQDKRTSANYNARNSSYSRTPGYMEIAIDIVNPENQRVVAQINDRREAGRDTFIKEMNHGQIQREVNYTFRLWADMLKTGLEASQEPRAKNN